MVFNDLRSFLDECEKCGDLEKVEGADWNLEIGTISELAAEKFGPVLLFDKIKGYPPGYRVATDLYTTKERIAMAFDMPRETPKLDIIKQIRVAANDFKSVKPIEVKSGPVMQNVKMGDDVDLLAFPTPIYHEHDGGRYIGTGHIAITRDPDTGYINAGVERVMIHDKNRLSFYISPGKHNRIIRQKYWDKGESCPVVMAFAPDPIVYLAGALHVPWGTSEFEWAGWMRKKPVEVIKGKVTGIPFPAHDEIVVEGEYLPPEKEQREEGPFGEWTGYYAGGRQLEPVVKVKALYYRDNPILAGVPPLKPPLHNFAVPIISTPFVWNDLEKTGISGIKGVWQLEAGGGRLITVISLKQEHIGHAKQAALVAAGGHGGGYMGRFVIVVDEDIAPTDVNDVLWAVATRSDPATSIDIIRDCWGTRLDPMVGPEKREKKDYSHSVAIINACKPFVWMNEFPRTNKASPELRKKVIEKWKGKVRSL